LRCSNDVTQQDIRVGDGGGRRGAFIVFLLGWPFLPVGPCAHGLSQPRAHGVLRDFHNTPCARGTQRLTQYPVRTGYPESYAVPRAYGGQQTPCARGVYPMRTGSFDPRAHGVLRNFLGTSRAWGLLTPMRTGCWDYCSVPHAHWADLARPHGVQRAEIPSPPRTLYKAPFFFLHP
jgi:hypothetical protein